jgi:hypothetical protein
MGRFARDFSRFDRRRYNACRGLIDVDDDARAVGYREADIHNYRHFFIAIIVRTAMKGTVTTSYSHPAWR